MAEGFNGLAMDQPAGTGNRPYAAESWLEPWLIKHSEFYRKHFAKDGRRESKSTRRHSVVAEGLESRKNSVAAPEADTEAAPATVPEAEATSALPGPVEQGRESVDMEAPAEDQTPLRKERFGSLRKSVGWFPHP